jgi:hypothetical protein
MIRLRTGVLTTALGTGLACLLAGDAATVGFVQPGHEAKWTEVKWPFPMDQWGLGRAFHCVASACGIEVNLYLRPKVGFCNCTTGVSDDAELERVGDLTIFSDRFVGNARGHEINVGWMKGRSRAYEVIPRDRPSLAALSIAFNDKCDVAVATVVADRARLAEAEQHALAFLNGGLVLHWAKAELGSDGF